MARAYFGTCGSEWLGRSRRASPARSIYSSSRPRTSIPAPDGKRFEFGPDKLLYGLRWLHKGEPPDLDLALAPPFVRAPEVWFPYVTTMLLGALQEVDPGLRRIAASP